MDRPRGRRAARTRRSRPPGSKARPQPVRTEPSGLRAAGHQSPEPAWRWKAPGRSSTVRPGRSGPPGRRSEISRNPRDRPFLTDFPGRRAFARHRDHPVRR